MARKRKPKRPVLTLFSVFVSAENRREYERKRKKLEHILYYRNHRKPEYREIQFLVRRLEKLLSQVL